MLGVRRLARDPHADQRDDVGGAVGQRVKAVGEHADRPGRQAQRDLGQRDEQIEKEDTEENAGDGGVAVHGEFQLPVTSSKFETCSTGELKSFERGN